ncbi:TetR/AcrR family transcriptional regulator [Nocardia sp. NPDC051321]|uniref:TetR/AcrR family transcriptional regulator n=1 Tax=Nocardia sp. NPDC051321 TaxID=3364323 RepID=UPI00379CBB68
MPTEPHGPRSRRERPAKPALTRPGIIATAVRLMRAEGLERVTMRRLAAELDTGPASLYVYLRNTAELHAAVLDEMLAAVDRTPVDASGDWQNRLVRVLTSYTMVLYDNPGLAQSALVARPSGPGYLNLLEAILALLSEGGVPDDRAAWLCDVLLLFATANAAEHATRDRDTEERDTDALVAAIRNASAETHPRIATLGDDLLSGPGSDRLDWGFHLLINGAGHTPRPAGKNP